MLDSVFCQYQIHRDWETKLNLLSGILFLYFPCFPSYIEKGCRLVKFRNSGINISKQQLIIFKPVCPISFFLIVI